MEKDRIMLVFGLILFIILFFYGVIALYNPEKINEWNDRKLKNKSEKTLNTFDKFVLKQSEKSRKQNFIYLRITGVGCLIMAIISILLILHKLINQ